jgi:hypothetical protein
MVDGRASSPLPMIPLPHDMHYLPAMRFEMTPYGTRWTTEHDIVRDGRVTSVSLGLGDTRQKRAWDFGVAAADVVRSARVNADVAAILWRQPPLDSGPNARIITTGGLAAATARISLRRAEAADERIAVFVQVGYKTDGFVRGERLHAGPILRAGVTFLPATR